MGSSSTSFLAMSSGNSIRVAPGLSVAATLNALRTISATLCSLRMDDAHLVTGLNIETMSMAWWDSLCRRCGAARPPGAGTGGEGVLAGGAPGGRVVGAGARREGRDPGPPLVRAGTV